MNDIFLAIIALAVLTMAAIQVAALVYAMRLMRRVDELTARIEQDIRPMFADLRAVTSDAAKAMALVAAQAERADRLLGDVAGRLEQAVAVVHEKIFVPLREGATLLSGIGAALAALRELRDTGQRTTSGVEEEDALFIG